MTRLAGLLLPFVLAGVDLWMVHHKQIKWQYFTKPSIVASLLIWLLFQPIPLRESALFLLALILSLAGDIFLLFPGGFFLAGLASFLLAHLAFIGYFQVYSSVLRPWYILFILFVAAIGIPYCRMLWTRLVEKRGARRLRILVMVYCLVLSVMLISTAGTMTQTGWPRYAAMTAWMGGSLFFISDCLLGYDRFVQPFRHARILVRSTYYLGQILLCAAVVLRSAQITY